VTILVFILIKQRVMALTNRAQCTVELLTAEPQGSHALSVCRVPARRRGADTTDFSTSELASQGAWVVRWADATREDCDPLLSTAAPCFCTV